jgi:CDP-6-deoxy-D-xylo-4-hexulose-3-dehydrase
MNAFYIPLMSDNIDKQDVNAVIDFLQQPEIPKLTNGKKVIEFENEWSKWLGVKYSLFVNSGSAANELTMLAIRYIYGNVEVIVPPLTWVSDIASVIHAGLTPIFCDINMQNLSFDLEKLKKLITPKTKAIFLTHVLGLNGLTQELLDLCKEKNILLIEDVCESHGATFNGKKVGSFGLASNFSFYFAHHMSTIEGGMICTNNSQFFNIMKCMRSHGMLRESNDSNFQEQILNKYPELNKDFVFIAAAHNFRSTELNAVIGLSQLPKLDKNNKKRQDNFNYFIQHLDSDKYFTNFSLDGQCNYAFIVILNKTSFKLRDKVEKTLKYSGIEFRRGLSGGGSQLKQPYLEHLNINQKNFETVEHVHHFSWYIGNYPDLDKNRIDSLLTILNSIYE